MDGTSTKGFRNNVAEAFDSDMSPRKLFSTSRSVVYGVRLNDQWIATITIGKLADAELATLFTITGGSRDQETAVKSFLKYECVGYSIDFDIHHFGSADLSTITSPSSLPYGAYINSAISRMGEPTFQNDVGKMIGDRGLGLKLFGTLVKLIKATTKNANLIYALAGDEKRSRVYYKLLKRFATDMIVIRTNSVEVIAIDDKLSKVLRDNDAVLSA